MKQANRSCEVVGVIHLGPLPGSPGYEVGSVSKLLDRASADAACLIEAGFDGYIVENFGDAPFYPSSVPPITLTTMTRIISALPRAGLRLGVNVLRNDALGALAVAAAVSADFIRVNVHIGAMVTDQGIIEGHAAQTLRERTHLAPDVQIYADVEVKHAQPLGPRADLSETARECAYRGLADGLIVSGSATGSPTAIADIKTVKQAVPDRPVWVGSGVNASNLHETLEAADGIIVGTALKEAGMVRRPIDRNRAQRFMDDVRLWRSDSSS